MAIRTILFLFALLFCISPEVNSQLNFKYETDVTNSSFRRPRVPFYKESGVNFSVLNVEYFETNKVYMGVAAYGMTPVFNWPFKFGIGAGFYMNPRETENIGGIDTANNLNSWDCDVGESGRIAPFNIKLRFDPSYFTDYPFIPYIGAIAGFRVFDAKYHFDYDYYRGTKLHYSTVVNDPRFSFTWHVGFEAGVKIGIGKLLALDFRYQNIIGGNVKYLDRATLNIAEDKTVSFDRIESGSNSSYFTAGLVFMIRGRR